MKIVGNLRAGVEFFLFEVNMSFFLTVYIYWRECCCGNRNIENLRVNKFGVVESILKMERKKCYLRWRTEFCLKFASKSKWGSLVWQARLSLELLAFWFPRKVADFTKVVKNISFFYDFQRFLPLFRNFIPLL
jgi:hypothetical protein